MEVFFFWKEDDVTGRERKSKEKNEPNLIIFFTLLNISVLLIIKIKINLFILFSYLIYFLNNKDILIIRYIN